MASITQTLDMGRPWPSQGLHHLLGRQAPLDLDRQTLARELINDGCGGQAIFSLNIWPAPKSDGPISALPLRAYFPDL
jgi:hypothetical protein